jgi:CRP/FNR family transcriptional regulator, cyclic AMP receptor protein
MASTQEVMTALGSVGFFSGLNQKQLKMVAESGKELSYKAGDTIVEEGTMGVGFYMLVEGKVEVRKGSKVLATLSKGQYFGEMSLIDEQPRSADVVALLPTKCFTISTWVFTALVNQHPELVLPMLKEFAKRLRAAQSSPTS